jgi:tetratricopeptide (TPR) repeat protein
MSLRTQLVFLTICLFVFLHESATSEQPPKKGKDAPKTDEPARTDPPDAGLIGKLIQQLGSSKFPERDAAKKQLEKIGEPALDALRNAGKNSADLETRRRAQQLAEQLELTILENLVKDGVQQHQKKDYKKAGEFFDKAIKKGLDRLGPKDGKAPAGEIPFLTEVFLHSARNSRELGDDEKAAKAYNKAGYYSNQNRRKRQEIDDERHQMATQLVSRWKGSVKANTDKDAALKKLVSKYPLVLLHSRRYAGGDYLQSAYSFLYETTVELKHYNDVQILFDNGKRDSNFYVRMLGGQGNRVADLGTVDFERNPDLRKLDAKGKIVWSSDECKAVEGHVYLENVRDERGNNFFVLFQMIAVDKESRYMAFVWRRLPGGKIVKREN